MTQSQTHLGIPKVNGFVAPGTVMEVGMTRIAPGIPHGLPSTWCWVQPDFWEGIPSSRGFLHKAHPNIEGRMEMPYPGIPELCLLLETSP